MGKIYEKECGKCGKVVRYYRGHKPHACPHCGCKRYYLPKTEVQLFELQDKYLINRKEVYMQKMYKILCSYAHSLIYKIVAGKYIFDQEEIQVKSHDAAVALLHYYWKKPEFRIDTSFGGYLQRKVKEVLYNQREKDEENHDSLNNIMQARFSNEEVGEFLDKTDVEYYALFKEPPQYDSSDTIEYFLKMLSVITNRVRKEFSVSDAFLTLIGLQHRIGKASEPYMDEYYEMFGPQVSENVEKGYNTIYQELLTMATER